MMKKLFAKRWGRSAWPLWLALAAILFATIGLALRSPSSPSSSASTLVRVVFQDAGPEAFSPLPLTLPLDTQLVELGRRLFYDPRLSHDGSVSCASCHDLTAGGVDHRVHSLGAGGAEGSINAPTVFNSGFNFVQFWDGRAPTLEDQVDGPVQNPLEMASSWPEVLGKLSQDDAYRETFARLFPDGVTRENVRHAIAEFERSLITPNAPFDRYLRGETDALDARQKRGLELFQNYGCVACHQGMNLGGNLYQQMGLMADYFRDRGNVTEADYGLFNVTRDPADKFFFRVPSLRNVALTYPYFHDGSAPNLYVAIRVMAHYQLGRDIPDEDVEAIASFLHSLTGELP